MADALLVTGFGAVFLLVGFAILAKHSEMYRIFSNAAALIGAEMLLGEGVAELIDKYEGAANWVMLPVGAMVAVWAGLAFKWGALTTRFVTGAIALMGLMIHLAGLAILLLVYNVSGPLVGLTYLCAAALLGLAGVFTDLRIVTVAAIVPFAQALDTGTFYFHTA